MLNQARKLIAWWPLAVVLLVSALPRFYQIGHGFGIHPDERHMIMVAEGMKWPNLNPKSFAYGSLPYYLLWFTAHGLQPFWPAAVSYDNLFIIGRVLSALFGLAGVVLTYMLAQSLYGRRPVSLLAAFLLACNVFHLQLSRFFTVDVMMTTLCCAALLTMLQIARGGPLRSYLLTGIFIGLSVATKITALFLLAPLMVAVVLKPGKLFRVQNLLLVAACLTVAGAAFVVSEPFALLDYATFRANSREQTGMVRGLWRPPYTIQYENTLPYLYHLKQMLLYTMNWPLAIASAAGLLYACYRLIRRPRQPELVALAYTVVPFLLIAQFQVKFPRYLIALYPVVFCFAAYVLVELTRAAVPALSSGPPPPSGAPEIPRPLFAPPLWLTSRARTVAAWLIRFKRVLALGLVVLGVLLAVYAAARFIFYREPPSIFAAGTGSGQGQFDQLMDLAVAPDGSIYAVDMLNARVQRYSASGKFLSAWGRKGSLPGEFQEPRGIAADEQGNVYVMDTWNGRVQKFDPQGTFLRDIKAEPGLYGAKGVAVRAGLLAVTDSGHGYVVTFDAEGRQLKIIGSKGSGIGQFQEPSGITIGPDGTLYVMDSGNNRIQQLSQDGTPLRTWMVPGWSGDTLKEGFMDTGQDGSIYLTDPVQGYVFKVTPAGLEELLLDREVNSPSGIAVRGSRLLIAERGAGKVVDAAIAKEPSN